MQSLFTLDGSKRNYFQGISESIIYNLYDKWSIYQIHLSAYFKLNLLLPSQKVVCFIVYHHLCGVCGSVVALLITIYLGPTQTDPTCDKVCQFNLLKASGCLWTLWFSLPSLDLLPQYISKRIGTSA